jgi:hypothetical protein
MQQLKQQFAGDAQQLESKAQGLVAGAQQAMGSLESSEQALSQRMQSAATAGAQHIHAIGTAMQQGGVDGVAMQPKLEQQFKEQRSMLEGHATVRRVLWAALAVGLSSTFRQLCSMRGVRGGWNHRYHLLESHLILTVPHVWAL